MLNFNKNTTIKIIINKGSTPFHKYNIKQSYRIRGKVHRAQINKVKKKQNKSKKKILFKFIPNTNNVLNIHIKRIDIYSPKNNKAKLEALYSVLNPETNSDSPSAKSKGVR